TKPPLLSSSKVRLLRVDGDWNRRFACVCAQRCDFAAQGIILMPKQRHRNPEDYGNSSGDKFGFRGGHKSLKKRGSGECSSGRNRSASGRGRQSWRRRLNSARQDGAGKSASPGSKSLPGEAFAQPFE